MSVPAPISPRMKDLLRPLMPVLWPVAIFSAVFNVLLLSGSFFMLLVYDNVLASRSIPTLAGLLLMVAVAYAFQAAIDIVRGRVLLQCGALADRRLTDRLYDVLTRHESEVGTLPSSGAAPVRDLNLVRNYLAGPGPLALFDLPYVLLFLLILALLHWTLGVVTLLGVAVLVALLVIGDRLTREPTKQAAAQANMRLSMAEDLRQRGETIRVLGMGERRRRAWSEISKSVLGSNDRLADVSGRVQGVTKAFRQFLQSLVLAVGAYLVIDGRATGGVIIAGSILSARALLPVEQTIGQWKAMIEARHALGRLSMLIKAVPHRIEPMALPAPENRLEVQQLTAGPPGMKRVTLANINFRLSAGEALAVIGKSGSGKSTLMRAIVGGWPALRGSVRLDGASLDQWEPADLGRHVGFMGQRVDLFEGTIAQNISRFEEDADPAQVIAAARKADLHELILSLSGGYDYRLGPDGGGLSAGQQQRLALARALYGDPFLIVLDEPNSNLDAQGESALAQAISEAKKRGAIVIIVGHRPTIFANVDYIAVIAEGQLQQMGRRMEMLEKLGFLQPDSGAPAEAKPQAALG